MKKTLSASTKSNLITYAMLAVIFAVVQLLSVTGNLSSLVSGLLVPICMYIILAVSLNLKVGILGDLSLGHAGFMCVGAYSSAIFSMLTKDVISADLLRYVLALLVGGAFAAIFGILIGIPVLRLKGDYLAIVTLAFGEIIKVIVNNMYIAKDIHGVHFAMLTSISDMGLDEGSKEVILNGPQGISGTPQTKSFVIAFVLVVITVAVILNLINSRTGRAIMSIRDNRIAAESVGINVTKYKLMAFSVSAFFAGVAGVIYSHNTYALQATTKNFGYDMSILILVLVVLGGIGSIKGSILSSIILISLPEILRDFQKYRMLIYAILLIVMMIVNNNPVTKAFFKKIFGSLKRLLPKKKAAEKSSEVTQ